MLTPSSSDSRTLWTCPVALVSSPDQHQQLPVSSLCQLGSWPWEHDLCICLQLAHSSLGNQTPAEARRALEQFEDSAHDALAQTDDEEYEIQTRKLSL